MTLTHFAERLAVELSLPVLGLSWLGFEHQTFRMRGKRSYPLRHRRIGMVIYSKSNQINDKSNHIYRQQTHIQTANTYTDSKKVK